MLTFKQWLKIPEFQQSMRRPVNIAQYLEICGAAMFSTGIYLVVGLGGALLAGSIFLIVSAEFVYGETIYIKIPKAPHPIKKIKHALRK